MPSSVSLQGWGLFDLQLRALSQSPFIFQGSLVDPRLRASNEHILESAHFPGRTPRLFKGRIGLSPTARVERPLLYRGGSASNGDNPSTPLLPCPR